MNSQSKILALKYRPKIFSDLIGQEIIAETISNAIKIGKTPNAYLLTGIRGVGKTTTARLIAKALNCVKESDLSSKYDQNSLCEHCKQIENSNHIDVLEMDAASKTGIDDIRELIESAKYNPTSAKYKIFIIDEVHMLSKQAFNGLLKTLEEPPEKLKFILATTDVRKIPVTILSRCQRFDLRRVVLDKVFDHIKKISKNENAKISDNALKLLAKSSEGSVRDAITLLDRALIFQTINESNVIEEKNIRNMLGLADKSKIISLITFVFQGDEKNSLDLFEQLIDEGLDGKNFLNDFLELIYLFGRRINLGKIEKDIFISDGELELIEKGCKNLKMEDIGLFWQLTLKTIEDLKIVPNERVALEMYLMQLIHINSIEDQENEKIFVQNDHDLAKPKKIQTEEKTNDEKISNSPKDQMKSMDQLKIIREKEKSDDEKFKITSFSQLLDISEKKKEIELKYDLERNVKLVSFEQGKIDINFNENLNKNFIKKLSQNLYEWTGKRWIISLSKEQKSLKTFHEKKIEDKEINLKEEKQSKLFKEMSEFFPDLELIDVRKEDE